MSQENLETVRAMEEAFNSEEPRLAFWPLCTGLDRVVAHAHDGVGDSQG